jgi:hypothetical protein
MMDWKLQIDGPGTVPKLIGRVNMYFASYHHRDPQRPTRQELNHRCRKRFVGPVTPVRRYMPGLLTTAYPIPDSQSLPMVPGAPSRADRGAPEVGVRQYASRSGDTMVIAMEMTMVLADVASESSMPSLIVAFGALTLFTLK